MPEKRELSHGCLVAYSSIRTDRVIKGSELPAAKLMQDRNRHQRDKSIHTHTRTHLQIGWVDHMGVCASIPSVSSLVDGRVSSALSVSLRSLCWRSKRSTRLLSQVNTTLLSDWKREWKIKSLKWSDRSKKRGKVLQRTERKRKLKHREQTRDCRCASEEWNQLKFLNLSFYLKNGESSTFAGC